jgi:hypothetical protein
MPVYVKDFSWHESDSSVFLSVPLRSIKPCNTDVFATDEYLKIVFGPFIFEASLPATIDGKVCRTFSINAIITVIFRHKRSFAN